jgi:hypothetical protein
VKSHLGIAQMLMLLSAEPTQALHVSFGGTFRVYCEGDVSAYLLLLPTRNHACDVVRVLRVELCQQFECLSCESLSVIKRTIIGQKKKSREQSHPWMPHEDPRLTPSIRPHVGPERCTAEYALFVTVENSFK